MALQGARELRARLKALKLAFKPVGREWAETVVKVARVPERTGKGRRSLRVKNATQRKATVSAIYYLAILDKGAKAHDIGPRQASVLRFSAANRTIFTKKVHKPRQAGLHWAGRAAREALRRNPMADSLIKQWNAAAR